MDVVSTCPLRTRSIVWQPQPGAWMLTVVCKATFVLAPGESRLADVQEEPTDEDGYWNDDETKSLHQASDLVPFKARADVLLVGSAFAPQRRPTRSLSARLCVGDVDKRVEVWCDRVFSREGRLLEGSPFAQMPLRYERAAGGPTTWNPVGMRFDAAPDAYGAVQIPNLQPSGLHITRSGETFAPTGFGPIGPTWRARTDKLSRHAAGWTHRAWSARPLPGGIDPAYFNTAPREQQLELLRPDEAILLENLHRDHPLLMTRLPGLRPVAQVTTAGSTQAQIDLIADTLWIDTDRGLASVVWRGRVVVSQPGEEGRIVVSLKAPSIAATTAEVGRRSGAATSPAARRSALLVNLDDEDGGTVRLGASDLATRLASAAALPFKPAQNLWAGGFTPRSETSPEPALSEDTGTLYGAMSPARAALPFAVGAPQVAPLGAARPTDPYPFASGPAAIGVAEPAPAFDPSHGVPTGQRIMDAREVVEERWDGALLPPPPPRIGPLATMEAGTPSEPTVAATAPEVPAPLAGRPPQAAELPLENFPIERCAAIAASTARTPADTTQILMTHDLDPAGWEALNLHWNAAVGKETERGKTKLLRSYDAAYVAQLEQERGPIQVDEYARLVVATEQGIMTEVLATLTLPPTAMMRIERVWLTKLAGDAELGKSVRRSVNAARAE
jgi:hypothetical protein